MCDGRLAWRDVALPIDNGFNCALSIECHRIGNTGHKNFADCSPLMSEDVVFGHKPLTQLRIRGEQAYAARCPRARQERFHVRDRFLLQVRVALSAPLHVDAARAQRPRFVSTSSISLCKITPRCELPATDGTGISVASCASSALSNSGTVETGAPSPSSTRLGLIHSSVRIACAIRRRLGGKYLACLPVFSLIGSGTFSSPSLAGSRRGSLSSCRSTMFAQHLSGSSVLWRGGSEGRAPGSSLRTIAARARARPRGHCVPSAPHNRRVRRPVPGLRTHSAAGPSRHGGAPSC
jgi:hypothetical protein